MRKELLSLGLIVLLTGMVFLVISAFRNTDLEIFEKTSYTWVISGNLSERQTYVLDIFSSSNWRDDFTMGGYTTPQPVDVLITSPNGNITWLRAFFYARGGTEWMMGPFPSLVFVDYGTVDSESLEVDESYPQVRFKVKQEGIYWAQAVESTLNWTSGPPKQIVLYKEVLEDQPSHFIFLYSGGIVCLSAGAIVSAWAATTSKKRRARPKKKL